MTTQPNRDARLTPQEEFNRLSVYEQKIIMARIAFDTDTEAAKSLGHCRQTVATTLKRYPGLVQKLRVALTQKLNS